MKVWKRLAYLISAVLVLALGLLAFLPSPVEVDVARASRGPLTVTVDEEGEARAHDRYIVAAPVAGRLQRIELHEGDLVAQGQLLASIFPLPLGVREHEEAAARIQTAQALSREADERVEQARTEYTQARRDRERAEQLVEDGVVSRQSFEHARNAEITAAKEFEAARFKAAAAASEVAVAKAALVALEAGQEGGRVIKLRSPVRGPVLRINEQSERVVAAGTPLLTLGDPNRLEFVVDLLSTDAVKVKPGATVLLEDWGGEITIRARVRLVEASAFTKVSALGIDEQRVNIIGDFVDPPGPLGDGYRVQARIVVWEADNVLKVASSALFRHEERWSVFVVEDGRAYRRDVEVGHRNQFEAEILSGLQDGALIILHPTSQIEDGSRVNPR